MVKVIRAEKDFEITRNPDSVSVTYSSVHRGRFTVMVLVLFGLIILAAVSGLVSAMSWFDTSRSGKEVFNMMFPTFLISSASAVWVHRWGYRKLPNTVVIDREGVTKDNRKYLFSDIEDIGWQFGSDGPTLITSRSQAAAMDLQRTVSGIVYISYGNRRVVLVAGLGEAETERAFQVLRDAMNEMGTTFGKAEATA